MTTIIIIPAELARKILWGADKPWRPGEYWINTDNRGRQWLYGQFKDGVEGPLAMNRLPLSWHDEAYPFVEIE